MYLTAATDPSIWELIKTPAVVTACGSIVGVCIWLVRWTWKLRGAVDTWINDQKTDRDLAQKTFEGIESAKKVAMEEVGKATAHGEEKANELRQRIDANQASLETINTNHLSHIEKDIAEINVKHDRLIGIGTKQLEMSQGIREGIAVLVALEQARAKMI